MHIYVFTASAPDIRYMYCVCSYLVYIYANIWIHYRGGLTCVFGSGAPEHCQTAQDSWACGSHCTLPESEEHTSHVLIYIIKYDMYYEMFMYFI